jgi:hypothetical protein
LNDDSKNIIREKYHLQDPTKYMIFRVRNKSNDKNDIINWSNSNSNENIVNRIKIQYNSIDRITFKDKKYFQSLHPYKRKVNGLNSDEFFYSFSLNPKSNQPSGSDNLSMFQDVSIFFDINENVISNIDDIEIDLYTKTYNVNLIKSGFSGLLFYGSRS